MNQKLIQISMPIWHAYFSVISILLLIGCDKPSQNGDPEIENPYRWQVKMPWTSVHPLYEDGHYYIFPIYETKQDLNFVKINEKTGEVVYDNIIHQNIDVYAFNPRYFKRNGNLVYLHGRYIFQLDLNNGKVITIDSFSNYIKDVYIANDYMTGASYTDDFGAYKYYEIVYEGGHYKENLIHKEYFNTTGSIWAGGSPPIKVNGNWLMEYSIFDINRIKTDSWWLIKSEDTLIRKPLLPGYSCSFEFEDENNWYCGCSDDRLICVEKRDFNIKWNIPAISGSEYTLYQDKIYNYNRDDRKRMNVINKYSGFTEPFHDFIPGNFARLNKDRLIYVADGRLQKLALETMTYDLPTATEIDDDEFYWGEYFGFSSKTKLLYNDHGWKCTSY